MFTHRNAHRVGASSPITSRYINTTPGHTSTQLTLTDILNDAKKDTKKRKLNQPIPVSKRRKLNNNNYRSIEHNKQSKSQRSASYSSTNDHNPTHSMRAIVPKPPKTKTEAQKEKAKKNRQKYRIRKKAKEAKEAKKAKKGKEKNRDGNAAILRPMNDKARGKKRKECRENEKDKNQTQLANPSPKLTQLNATNNKHKCSRNKSSKSNRSNNGNTNNSVNIHSNRNEHLKQK